MVPCGWRRRRVNDLGGGQLAFDFLDAAFNEALAVLGGLVFGVFAQVALCARLGNGVDDPGTLDGLEFVKFGFELFRAALGNGDGGHVVVLRRIQKETAGRCRRAVRFAPIIRQCGGRLKG